MDMSLGGLWNGNYNNVTSSIHRYDGTAPFNRLLGNNIDKMLNKIAARWHGCKEDVLSVEELTKRIDDYAKQFVISGAWEREVMRWNNNPVELKDNLQEEIDYVIKWYEKNVKALDQQFHEETAINDIPTIRKSPHVITLDGRHISNTNIKDLPKGIYIVDGKKLIIGE